MSTHPHDIEAVRRLLLPVDAEEPAAREAVWQALRASSAAACGGRSRPRRTRGAARFQRRLWLGVPVAAAAAAGIAGPLVVMGGSDGGGLGVLSAQPAAAAVLERAAELLRDDRPLASGEVRVVQSSVRDLLVEENRTRTLRYPFVLPRTVEDRIDRDGRWSFAELPAAGEPEFASPAARAEYLRAFDGHLPPLETPTVDPPVHAATEPNDELFGLSFAEVNALPTEQSALAARVRTIAAGAPADGPHDMAAVVVRLLTNGSARPELRAALAELLATLPGVQVVGREEIGGVPGTTLQVSDMPDSATQFTIGDRDGELLATRQVLTKATARIPGSHPGMVVSVTTYSTAVVDSFDAPAELDPPTIAGPDLADAKIGPNTVRYPRLPDVR